MDTPADPYRTCEHGRCQHDLARAVTVAELWATDGPFTSQHLVVDLSARRPALFDDDEAAAVQHRWAV